MSDSPSQKIEEFLRESTETYEKALTSGINLQEDTINLWKDALRKLGSPEKFQAKLEEITTNLIPAARKRMEEVVETLSRSGDQALSLCEKTASVCKAPTLLEAQHRIQDLTESYFVFARNNLKITFDANTRVIGYWRDLMGRMVPVAK